MALLGLRESLPSLVRSKYLSAKTEANALTFAATELAIVKAYGLPFQLRYCPALAKKPTPIADNNNASTAIPTTASPSPTQKNPKKSFDPFEHPDPNLLIAHVPTESPTHSLVLNKYPVIPNHFIIATKQNKPQTAPLEADDLWLTYQCLREWAVSTRGTNDRSNQEDLFAFFNSGRHSGASQPHRHVQMLPVEDMKHGLVAGKGWELFVDALYNTSFLNGMTTPGKESGTVIDLSAHVNLPFRIFGCCLPPIAYDSSAQFSPQYLYNTYKELYYAAEAAVHTHLELEPDDFEPEDTHQVPNALPISYNMVMTTRAMLLCPRRSEGREVRRESGGADSDADGQQGEVIDSVALNGTILGGTMMVKNEEVWTKLKRDNAEFTRVLEAVGLPPSTEKGAQKEDQPATL
ncbi:MAG: bifunctional AP-4-A phosphorylase/ADP sulfurylase [Alyxoria varia]|nr:MAG: bifunctional AP-4-A phosphorylase/ADP sulfurylase [Alyxoria varia]